MLVTGFLVIQLLEASFYSNSFCIIPDEYSVCALRQTGLNLEQFES